MNVEGPERFASDCLTEVASTVGVPEEMRGLMTDFGGELAGHAFLSYVREDSAEMDRLQEYLEAAGVRVWRDTESLFPGQDWRVEIRKAITDGALVFLACFSNASTQRTKSYQNEELALAVDQYRLRPPGTSWLIPVRLDPCELPAYDLGAGRDLGGLQRVDLFGDKSELNKARLLSTVLRLLGSYDATTSPVKSGQQPEDAELTPQIASATNAPTLGRVQESTPSIAVTLKQLLTDPSRKVDAEDELKEIWTATRARLLDTKKFPLQFTELASDALPTYRFLVEQATGLALAVDELCDALVLSGAYANQGLDNYLTRIMRSVGSARRGDSGSTALIALQGLPTLLVAYAGALGAVDRRNYRALKAIVIDPMVTRPGRDAGSLVGFLHPEYAFEYTDALKQVLAYSVDSEVTDELVQNILNGRTGKRYTPIPDWIHNILSPKLAPFVFDAAEYDELFDNTEILLAALAIDAKAQARSRQQFSAGAWSGRYVWRVRHATRPPEVHMREDLVQAGENSELLRAGLFGGQMDRATSAFDELIEAVRQNRERMW